MRRHFRYIPLYFILAIVAYFYFSKLGRSQFWDWDECLYAQYAREMPLAKHFLTNIWNGYIDMQKPPLYSWLLQIPRVLFGESEFSFRLLSALPAMGIITAVYVFCVRRFNTTIAILSSLILLTAELFVIYSLRLNVDMLYTLFIFGAVWSWLNAKSKSKYVLLTSVFLGLATLVKGIGTIQILGTMFLSLWIYPKVQFVPKKDDFIRFIQVLLGMLLIIVPWHVLAYLKYGDKFVHVYFYENIIKRGTYPIEFHRERWWFYFVLIERELRPWIYAGFIFPIMFVSPFIKNFRTIFRRLVQDIDKNTLVMTLLLFITIPLISFIRFQTRIAWYVLPLYPFIAIYLGYNIFAFIHLISKRFNKSLQAFVVFMLTSIVVLCISFDAGRLLIREVQPQNTIRELNNREKALFEIAQFPQENMEYLVPFSERQAREILPPTEQIDMTWVYGGNPCAVFYTGKKVHYYYTIEEFKENLGTSNTIYLLHKDDFNVLFKTDDFTSIPQVRYVNDDFVVVMYN